MSVAATGLVDKAVLQGCVAQTPPTTVVVADDHPVFRDGLMAGIKSRPDLRLVGQAASGREAIDAVRELAPKVALIDMKMPDVDGLGVLKAVVREEMETRVVLLSAFLDSELVYRAFQGGAAGFLHKEASRDEICDAVVHAGRGRTVMSPAMQGVLAKEIRMHSTDERPQLSPREREVLTLAAEGFSSSETAAQLHLSVATVKTHLVRLYGKLGVSDRAAAVAEAFRRGLIE